MAYTEFTAPVSITNTTEGTANTIVTAAAFTADGVSAYFVEYFSADGIPSSGAAGRQLTFVLYLDGASIGQWGICITPAAANVSYPIRLARRTIPAAGSRTYSCRAFVSAGTGTVDAQTGGSGSIMPGYIRITKAT